MKKWYFQKPKRSNERININSYKENAANKVSVPDYEAAERPIKQQRKNTEPSEIFRKAFFAFSLFFSKRLSDSETCLSNIT